MAYSTLEECISDLERTGQLIRINEEVDPNLEMAAIHLRVFQKGGPALLFENLKECSYRAVSNLFGTMERCRFIFRDSLDDIPKLIQIKQNPGLAFRNPLQSLPVAFKGIKAIPKKVSFSSTGFTQISINQLPLLKHWPDDGGAFITLPQVYSEDPEQPGLSLSNLGMYRIQLSGNDYQLNREIGLHYQIHRGIGVHQAKANEKGQPLKVSIFVGGPPAHTVAAVMPLPEGMSELNFAGVLGNRRFRYAIDNGYLISADADFVITGLVYPNQTKSEGPFGDHLGYYSLQHPFPVMQVEKVYAKRNAIWPFTVVGRPPQEDTCFGLLIHELTGQALQHEIPGLKEVNAVDAAGVHPLLLAIGSERYTPYSSESRPSELLTIANRVLGTGQLSLAKYLFITSGSNNETPPSTTNIQGFLKYFLERIDFNRDLHFQTQTSMDTLDYSGEGLNHGSKLILAAYGEKRRALLNEIEFNDSGLQREGMHWILPGILSVGIKPFSNYPNTIIEFNELEKIVRGLNPQTLEKIALIVGTDNAAEAAANLDNFLWITFTRSNPSHDVYGVKPTLNFKHWGCNGPLMVDARKKPFHAPELKKDLQVEQNIERIFRKGGSLFGKM